MIGSHTRDTFLIYGRIDSSSQYQGVAKQLAVVTSLYTNNQMSTCLRGRALSKWQHFQTFPEKCHQGEVVGTKDC